MNLIGELEAATSGAEVFRKLDEYMAAPEEKGIDKLHDAYSKAISLPSRVESMKGLTEALKSLVALEREAYRIVTHASNEAAYEDGQKALAEMRPRQADRA